jgi:hypothetical protein
MTPASNGRSTIIRTERGLMIAHVKLKEQR